MTIKTIAAAAVLAAVSTNLQAQTLVNSGTYGGNSYQVYDDPKIDWADAETFATSHGGFLAVVLNSAQNNYIAGLDPRGEYWLGGYQTPGELNKTNSWNWVHGGGTFPGVNGATGFTQSFSDWAPGEPNDDYGPGSEQWLAIGLEGAALWNDEGNLNNMTGFVVEYSRVPDSGSLIASFGLTFLGLAAAHRRFTAKTA